jgi:hypothetical protein
MFRGLAGKEKVFDEILNQNNVQISVITGSNKKLQGTKRQHYTVIYSGVERHTRGQSGVMIWLWLG